MSTVSTIKAGADRGWAWKTWKRILERGDPDACAYCGIELWDDTRTIDHVRPQMQGGGNSLSNLVLACVDCNGAKGNLDPVLFIRQMRESGRYRGDSNPLLKAIGAQPPRSPKQRAEAVDAGEPYAANLDGWVARRSGMSAFHEAEQRRRKT